MLRLRAQRWETAGVWVIHTVTWRTMEGIMVEVITVEGIIVEDIMVVDKLVEDTMVEGIIIIIIH